MHNRTLRIRALLAPTLLLALHCGAQTPPTLSSLRAAEVTLERPDFNGDRQQDSFSFNHFEVVDCRADTSRIGIHTCVPDFGPNHDRQLIFPQAASAEIAGYLNRHFTRAGAPWSALVILRTLWLSDANINRPDLLRHPERHLERTHIRIKVEIYAIRDHRYLPILRFDTLQKAWKKRILAEPSPYVEWGRNLSLLIDQLADSAMRLTIAKAAGAQSVDLDAIRHFDSVRFHAPINETSPARGVYANFEEFRNNTPSIKDFEVRLENHQRLLYIRESGTAFYSHDVWGYSDGKDIYIMRDGVLCPAWKEGKAFYIPAGAARATSGEAPTYVQIREYRGRTIYFVDMDTGDIY